MMMGVAQVIGMKPTFKAFFSSGAPCAKASVAVASGKSCEIAASAGVPIEGHCWFPFVDSCDWDTLLRRCDCHRDPVGIYFLDETLQRHPSSISRTFALAASGCRASELPAYHFQQPTADWLRGWMPQMAHWDWQLPPIEEREPENKAEPFDPLGARKVA